MAKASRRMLAGSAAAAAAALDGAAVPVPAVLSIKTIEAAGGGAIVFRPLDRLGLSPKNERTIFDQDQIKLLALDIEKNGLLQNLVIYPSDLMDDFDLVAGGGRRWRALNWLDDKGRLPKALVQHGIPCKRVPTEAVALVVTVVENMRREDVHFLDRAKAFARLRDELGLSNIEIGELVLLSNDAVGQYLRIHDRLPDDLRAAALRGEINFKQARILVAEKKAVSEPPPEVALPLSPVIASSVIASQDIVQASPRATQICSPPERCAVAIDDIVIETRPVLPSPSRRIPGEIAWPNQDYACLLLGHKGASLTFMTIVERKTGKRLWLVPEQRDIEDGE